MVLPDGTLFGEGVKTRIKERLFAECDLHTVVRLPDGVFAPYTGIKTNLLFFTRGRATRETWFYEHPYPAGQKSYSKTRPLRLEEFDAERAWWAKREENERAWRVTADEVRARGYNLDVKNPHAADDGHEEPEVLVARYEAAKAEAERAREALRVALMEALGVGAGR